MKKLIQYIAPLLLLTACDKKLDVVNPNLTTTSTFWKTESQAFASVTAVYNALITDGSYQRSFPGLTDSRGDDFTGDSPWTDLVQTGQFLIPTTSAPVEWIWRDFYMVIFRANQVLHYVPLMEESVLSKSKKDRILGQAFFLRGLAYYNLATTFKNVPLLTGLPPEDLKTYNAAAATDEDLWNHIISDFKTAEGLLPISYNNVEGQDRGQVGRATMGSAAGMLAKAYLYRKQWQLAADQCEKFFNGPLKGVYSLMPNYRDNFLPTNENNSESLFEVQFNEKVGSVANWTGEPTSTWRQFEAFSITYAMEGVGFSDYLPTRWIYNEYKLEKTIEGKSDPRLLATIASYEPGDNSTRAYGREWFNPTDRIYPRKYTYDGIATTESFEASGINYRVLRYADIYLMYAEALNELNRTAEAYPYIQVVRSRAKLPDLATTKPGLTQVQMRDQLAHERALEFAIEGQRINDIIRWGWLYNPTKLAELKAHDPDFNTWTPGNEYLPIPQAELNVNKALTPNPAN
ncbi:RagB/SusD family nutrient uptake outer membrane protein [Desertivirga brevis]|uniref:RagB/SusD family nutrient uptake outer membrane protein n=1 Tax=Desertivirga brevis TaxID=2810310 RepID=UPI001A975386|nr:RagB/SusD family nutrient uptake outer membrane protein [Pedobacter sp. SYSU D00873]